MGTRKLLSQMAPAEVRVWISTTREQLGRKTQRERTCLDRRAVAPAVLPAAAGGRGGVSGGVPIALALSDHRHAWVRLPGTVGLFACAGERCVWAAVCPGCLNSLDVALRAQAGMVGMALCWCPVHGGEGGA